MSVTLRKSFLLSNSRILPSQEGVLSWIAFHGKGAVGEMPCCSRKLRSVQHWHSSLCQREADMPTGFLGAAGIHARPPLGPCSRIPGGHLASNPLPSEQGQSPCLWFLGPCRVPTHPSLQTHLPPGALLFAWLPQTPTSSVHHHPPDFEDVFPAARDPLLPRVPAVTGLHLLRG